MLQRNFCLLLSFIFIYLKSFSQTEDFILTNLTQANGLPSNETYYIFEDTKHYLWIATDRGLARYNGKKMDYFSLPDNVIFKIKEDKDGRIFFFSQTGLLAYFFNEKIYTYENNDGIKASIQKLSITDACINDSLDLIINSAFGKNYLIKKFGSIEISDYYLASKDNFTKFEINQIDRNKFFAQRVNFNPPLSDSVDIEVKINSSLIHYRFKSESHYYNHYGCIKTKKDDIFFFAGKEILKLNSDGTFKIKKFSSDILCLYNNDSDIWVGFMQSGAVLLDENLIAHTKDTLTNKTVSSITKDYEGNLWFSTTESGIYCLKENGISRISGNSILNQPVFRLAQLNDSLLLFANAKGLYQLIDNKISLLQKLNNRLVSDIFTNNENIYWGVSANFDPYLLGFVRKSINSQFKYIYTIRSTSEIISLPKRQYLVSHVTAVSKFDSSMFTNNKIYQFTHKIHSQNFFFKQSKIFLDQRKNVWLGNNDGLYKLDTLQNLPLPFKISPGDTFENGVSCISQLENGIYATGLRFGGILLFKEGSVIGKITFTDGLLSNSINYILPQKDKLWIATSKGISVIKFISFSPLQYTITNIGQNEGLFNMNIYQLISFNENILAATSNGIYKLSNPQKFLTKTPDSIPLYINSINYLGIDTSNITQITASYKYNRIVVKYSAICFNSANEIKYYYNLSEVDTIWHENNSDQIILENLSPGTYKLKIKARIKNNERFSSTKELTIVIEKPWWQNNWFRILLLLIIVGFGYLFYKRKVITIRQKEEQKFEQKIKMAELEQTALRSQMNPHFIFNCLTSIQQLIISKNTTDANEYLVKFSRLIRKTLEFSSQSFISIYDEKEYLKEYLLLEQMRFQGRFDFTFNIYEDIDIVRTLVPTMMLQPIIENCIRHGIKPLVNRMGNISITILRKGNSLFCVIKDNGVGYKHKTMFDKNIFSEHKSYGIEIVRRRLELLFEKENKDIFIKITDLHPDLDDTASGTLVTIQLPLRTNIV